MERRNFLKSCALTAATLAGSKVIVNDLHAAATEYAPHTKALLTKADGTPLRAADIEADKPYIFFYPQAATPCYLINVEVEVKPTELTNPDGFSYQTHGGVGKARNIVAYSVICPHQWAYPQKEYTAINYYGKDDKECVLGSQLIKCCAHYSVYDPKEDGKKVKGAEASVPNLAMIVLEYDEGKDEIYAVGVAGAAQFDRFFKLYKKELRKEYGSSKKAKAAVDKAVVMPLSEYTADTIKC